MTDQTCRSCKFWLDTGSERLCRRYPPIASFIPGAGVSGPQTVSFFPGLDGTGWCGEWRAAGVVGTTATVTPLFPAEPEGKDET